MRTRLISAGCLLGLLAIDLPSPAAEDQLPAPTGKFGIGRCVFDWTDASRLETQSDKSGKPRELLVYLFYPTDTTTSGPFCEYFPHRKEVEAFEERFGKNFFRESYGSSYETICRIKSHAIEGLPPAAGDEKFPLLIFSHGGGIPVLCYTAIIENMVSHGYVVAAVEHTFDGATVVFPDGRIITQSGWDQDTKRTKREQALFHAERHRVGAQDNRFVLDQLERCDAGTLKGAPERLKGRLDTTRAGALGHSLGGMISIVTGRQETRFRMCLNLDGGLDAGQTYGTLRAPVAAMFGDNRKPRQPGEGTEAFTRRKGSRERYVKNTKAPFAGAPKGSYFLLVDSPGFSHFSYFDFPNVQAEEAPWRTTPERWRHNQRIILDATLAVFDAQLRGRSNALDDLLKRFPEVVIEPVP
jgi:hypothetical protein